MTTADSDPARAGQNLAAEPVRAADPTRSEATTDAAQPRGCPFLLAEGGGWRLDLPTRDHRCAAVLPPAPLSPEKQSRLCLTSTHTSCATYLASVMARQTRLGRRPEDRTTRWGLARTTTVIEDPGGIRARVLALLLDRRRWPAIPAVLLVTTLFTLALSGFRAGGSELPAGATQSPSPTASTGPTARATPRQAGTPTPEESPSGAPSIAPGTSAPGTATPATAAPAETFRTHSVSAGDTLSALAARFDTTSRAIAQLNNIPVTATLRIGQVLLIPN